MLRRRLDRQKSVCLGGGIVVGIAATLAIQWVTGPTRVSSGGSTDRRRTTEQVPEAAAVLAAESDASQLQPLDARKAAGPRSATDWERVAAQYAAPGSDSSLARSLMLRLDPKALRKLALSVATWPRSRRNQRALREIFHRWGEVDPEAAIAQAQTLPGGLAFEAARQAVDGYADSDPAGASAFLAAPPTGDSKGFLRSYWSRSFHLGQALENWAEQDAGAAAAFANGLPKEAVRGYFFNGLAEEWMRQDPQAALGWAQGLGTQNQRANALNGIVTTWSETDPKAAANFVLGQTGLPTQDDLVKTLATNWAWQDESSAARWVTEQSGKVQATAAGAVAESWVNKNPLDAAVWSGQLPAGDARNAAWGAIGKEWYINDAPAAQNWINSLPTGDGRDAALVGAAEYWNLRNQPTEILGMVQGISNPQVRDNTLTTVLNAWLKNDASAAHQWIDQTDLPSAVTGKLSAGH